MMWFKIFFVLLSVEEGDSVQGKPIFETTVNDYWQKRFVKTWDHAQYPPHPTVCIYTYKEAYRRLYTCKSYMI